MGNHRLLRAGTGNLAYGQTPSFGGYQSRQVANIIRRYEELRSAVELVAARQERSSGGSSRTGKEEILCTLLDIDQAIEYLSPRQKLVLRLMKQGHSYEQIGSRLGVGTVTVKFHAHQGIFQVTTYLNLS
jgi:DNA-binding NarL/FixJ family response regulator